MNRGRQDRVQVLMREYARRGLQEMCRRLRPGVVETISEKDLEGFWVVLIQIGLRTAGDPPIHELVREALQLARSEIGRRSGEAGDRAALQLAVNTADREMKEGRRLIRLESHQLEEPGGARNGGPAV